MKTQIQNKASWESPITIKRQRKNPNTGLSVDTTKNNNVIIVAAA